MPSRDGKIMGAVLQTVGPTLTPCDRLRRGNCPEFQDMFAGNRFGSVNDSLVGTLSIATRKHEAILGEIHKGTLADLPSLPGRQK